MAPASHQGDTGPTPEGPPPDQAPVNQTMASPGALGNAAPGQSAPSERGPAKFNQTMVGMMAPVQAAPQQGAAQTPALSGPSPAASQTPAVPSGGPQRSGAFKQTMIGMAAPVVPSQPAAPSQSAGQARPGSPDLASAATGGGTVPSFTSTLASGSGAPAGANPSPAPAGSPAPSAATPAPAGSPPSPAPGPAGAAPNAAGGAAPPGLSHKQTMLGVAMPGIAPINPGASKPAPASPLPPAPSPVASAPALPTRKVPRGAWVLLAVAAVLLAGVLVFALLWRAPEPMTANVGLDDSGREALTLTCNDCPDETTVEIQGVRSTFSSHEATLVLPEPLTVGDNHISVSVQRPGIGRDERVELSVPVEYRLRGDLTALKEDPPKLRVVAKAVAGSSVVVDGTALELDDTGEGSYETPVADRLTGPADDTETLEQKIPYVVTTPDGESHEGDVTLRLAIVPLSITAPGPSIVIDDDDFILSGRTLKDGTIEVEGRPITVDGAGRFSQRMNVSSVGETTITIRASAKDHAPRLARVHVERVESLVDYAAIFRKDALTRYDDAAKAAGDSRQAKVALSGNVEEARTAESSTVILLDVDRGCAETPCLARLVYGDRLKVARGRALTAFGTVTRSVDGPRTGDRIPEVSVEFVLIEGNAP